MSKNVDVIAICVLLLAVALFSGIKEVVSMGLFGPGGPVRIERNGTNFYVHPAIPPMPPMPPMPQVQRN
jgi:hypothetical protein